MKDMNSLLTEILVKVKCFNVIVWGIAVSKVEKSNVLMLLCGE